MSTPTWRIERDDALTTLHTMATASVDAVITDPPYNSGGHLGITHHPDRPAEVRER